jgi:hypothetical protein
MQSCSRAKRVFDGLITVSLFWSQMTMRRVWAHDINDEEKEGIAPSVRTRDVQTRPASLRATVLQGRLVSAPLVRDAFIKQSLLGHT